jgi:hypothetical protein
LKVPVWALNADFETRVRLGELTVEDGHLRCINGKGTISGIVPCEQLRQLLSRRFGAFIGQPFQLRYAGVMMAFKVTSSLSGGGKQTLHIEPL